MVNTLTIISLFAIVIMANIGSGYDPETYKPSEGSYLSELQKVQCETGHPACPTKRNK